MPMSAARARRRAIRARAWRRSSITPTSQRKLLTMKALTQIARAICYACAHAIDMARVSDGDEARHWQERANLLTPIAKAFSTDVGVEVASLGVQVHGGMGFIEETGAAQPSARCPHRADLRGHQRHPGDRPGDAQAAARRRRARARLYRRTGDDRRRGARVRTARTSAGPPTSLEQALDDLREATRYLQNALGDGRTDEALAGATPYLRLFALAAGGAYLARAALADGDAGRIALCRFFAENMLGETAALKDRVIGGAGSLQAAAKTLISA